MEMKFRPCLWLTAVSVCLTVLGIQPIAGQEPDRVIRVGIIGLDTSHSIAFTKEMNRPEATGALKACQVVCAYPHGSPDIESSVSRIPKYTQEIKAMGVEVVDSIDDLLQKVDAVLLETNDGRPHLEQLIPVLRAGKPTFIDKPIAASLEDAVAIFAAAEHFEVPVFSASSLRFVEPALQAREGKLVGDVLGCATFSPAKLEPTHPDLYWYGIHGVEQLFTVMGPECESVSRTNTESTDVVVGIWKDGRIGTFRGTRSGPHAYGGTVFGSKGQASSGGSQGYGGLVKEIASFFQTGKPPVDAEETLAIYAFMSAADDSLKQGGKAVTLQSVLEQAQARAKTRLANLGIRQDQ